MRKGYYNHEEESIVDAMNIDNFPKKMMEFVKLAEIKRNRNKVSVHLETAIEVADTIEELAMICMTIGSAISETKHIVEMQRIVQSN